MTACRCDVGPIDRITASTAQMEWFDGNGRGWKRSDAVRRAVSEAVERYAVCHAGVHAPVMQATARALRGEALAPESFVRPSPRERKDHDVTWGEATSDSSLGWYPGHELGTGRRTFAPAQLVFGAYTGAAFEATIRPATSKGAAAHLSDAAAQLSALLEVIEVDAFMITYLNRSPVGELDLSTTVDRHLERVVEAAGEAPGGFVRVWSLPTDCGVPVVLAALGGSLYGDRVVTFGCAAALEPQQAVTAAVQEAIHTTAWLDSVSVAATRSRSLAQLLDASETRTSHKLLGVDPRYLELLGWLFTAPDRLMAIDELPRVDARGSVAEDLAVVVHQAASAGLSPCAFDLTPQDVVAGGLRVWRVLAPEAQPFTLGRLRHLDSHRLRQVPVNLGLADRPLEEQEFNSVPHPCP